VQDDEDDDFEAMELYKFRPLSAAEQDDINNHPGYQVVIDNQSTTLRWMELMAQQLQTIGMRLETVEDNTQSKRSQWDKWRRVWIDGVRVGAEYTTTLVDLFFFSFARVRVCVCVYKLRTLSRQLRTRTARSPENDRKLLSNIHNVRSGWRTCLGECISRCDFIIDDVMAGVYILNDLGESVEAGPGIEQSPLRLDGANNDIVEIKKHLIQHGIMDILSSCREQRDLTQQQLKRMSRSLAMQYLTQRQDLPTLDWYDACAKTCKHRDDVVEPEPRARVGVLPPSDLFALVNRAASLASVARQSGRKRPRVA
jgi:hypothetical protein